MVLEPYLFVYGKLKQNQLTKESEILNLNSEFVGEAYVFGKLYKIEDYPALIPDLLQQYKVFGEVYKILNINILNTLDAFEEAWPLFGDHAEYKRLQVNAIVAGNCLACQAYVYNWPVSESKRIISGIW